MLALDLGSFYCDYNSSLSYYIQQTTVSPNLLNTFLWDKSKKYELSIYLVKGVQMMALNPGLMASFTAIIRS